MDIFSLGCTITELFLDGTPLFTFPQLLAFRNGSFDPSSTIDRIEDASVREMIFSMISLDPKNRLSAQQYLDRWFIALI